MKVRNRYYALQDEIEDGGQGSGEAPAVVPDAPAAESSNWDAMLDDFDESAAPESEAPPPSPPTEERAPEPHPEVKAEPPKAPSPDPAQAAQTPPAPVKAPEVPATPTPTPPPVDYAALRAEAIKRLEQQYAIPAEQATQLLTEPETILPKLAAQIHQAAVEQVLQHLQGILPQAVSHITAQQVRESEAKQAFFSKWPELQGYEQQVLAAGQMFRQINPTATREQAMDSIGQLAMQALGLSRAAPPAAPPPTPTPAPPFTPAGGRTGTPAPRPTPTVWDEMMNTDAYD